MERNHLSVPTGVVRCTSVTNARRDLNRLIAGLSSDGVPIHITGPHGNAVLVSEDDWNALQETLYLQSIPGMTEALKAGMTEDPAEMTRLENIEW